MRSDWSSVKTYIETAQDGANLSLLSDEELHCFADALDRVFQDVVFLIVGRRIHSLDDVTPGAQGA